MLEHPIIQRPLMGLSGKMAKMVSSGVVVGGYVHSDGVQMVPEAPFPKLDHRAEQGK